jgi:polysaccharide biosynthesis/export protein
MSMTKLKLALFSLLLCLSVQGRAAQEDYILGAGDKIRIEIVGERDMDTEAIISPSGTVTFWVLGDIKVADKSVRVFKEELTKVLSEKYLQKPVVKVEIKEYHSKELVIQGAVAKPGTYYLQTNSTTVLKLISEAGGASANVGTRGYIIRGYVTPGKQLELTENQIKAENNRIEVDMQKLLQQGDLQEDKPVYPGDFVFITSTESEELNKNFVWVEGAVRSPGKINYQKGLTLLAAIIQAGDFNEYAGPNKTTIHRVGPDGKTITIKVKAKNIRKGKLQDVPLQPGDRVSVPESAF